jgi:PhzF family phenazine biosynthesis protein
MQIWTVDAFTNKPFHGNPAGVVLIQEFLSDEMCQKIAGELNLPETSFIKQLKEDHFHIRWFTPTVEVELCGHGTLAAAHILFQEKRVKGNKISFDSAYGPLFVTQERADIVLDFPLIKAEGEPFSMKDIQDLLDFKSLKCAILSEGAIVAELSDEDELRGLDLDPEKVKKLGHNGLVVTTLGKAPYDFVSRVFGPLHGINEDPVTGSVHCLLADYWRKKLGKEKFLAYQASPRGGILGIKIKGDRALLKGPAITILKGELKIPLS